MKLFVTPDVFISVIKLEQGFSCLPMILVNGMGMYNTNIYEDQTHVVSCVLDKFQPTKCETFEDVCNYHKEFFYNYFNVYTKIK